LGFAIPVELVKRIIPQLINSGRVALPSIGVVPAERVVAARLSADGIAIARVEPGSPAARAGLRASSPSVGLRGDIITAANGLPVRSAFDLSHQVEQLGIGRRVELTISRDGLLVQVDLEIVDGGGKL
jgi:2-alkenal reductase